MITEAGRHPKVAALVYIAAFAPDKGESVQTIVGHPPSFTPQKEGYLFQDKAKMAAAFGADVDPKTAGFWVDSQVPFGVDAHPKPAWREKPSWYLVAKDNKMIPLTAQRQMSSRAGSTVVEVSGSHAIYVSNPQAVAALIEQAAERVNSAA